MLKNFLFSSVCFLSLHIPLKASDNIISQEEIQQAANKFKIQLEEIEQNNFSKYFPEISNEDNEQYDESWQESTTAEINEMAQKDIEKEGYIKGLSIDGGGMRGLMPALWLNQIEKITNRPIYKLFDYIAGTSIGGILALGYTAPVEDGCPLPSSKFIELFEQQGGQIFPQRSKYNIFGKIYDELKAILHTRYDPASLEALLQGYFKSVTLGESLSHVTVTSVNSITNAPFLFHSFDSRYESEQIWKVGRATSAAPTFFKSYKYADNIELIDGGMLFNNPTSLLMGSMKDHYNTKEKHLFTQQVVMLSLGTGEPHPSIIGSNAGWANAAEPVIGTLMNSSSIHTNDTMTNRFKNEFQENQYLRVNPKLSKYISLDSVSPQDIQYLRNTAESQYELIENFFTSDDSKFRLILEKND